MYFAFADGRLHYDCMSCGAACCRGHGYTLSIGAEVNQHLEGRSALRFFMTTSGLASSSRVFVDNCPPSCFFLTDTGHCRIHVDRGHRFKPETCRLFPFNRLRRLGAFLVVAPHLSLCPLQVTPPGVRSRTSSHDTLLEALADQGVATKIPDGVAPNGHLDHTVMVEREIVELSE